MSLPTGPAKPSSNLPLLPTTPLLTLPLSQRAVAAAANSRPRRQHQHRDRCTTSKAITSWFQQTSQRYNPSRHRHLILLLWAVARPLRRRQRRLRLRHPRGTARNRALTITTRRLLRRPWTSTSRKARPRAWSKITRRARRRRMARCLHRRRRRQKVRLQPLLLLRRRGHWEEVPVGVLHL